jgi:hypothetical protein
MPDATKHAATTRSNVTGRRLTARSDYPVGSREESGASRGNPSFDSAPERADGPSRGVNKPFTPCLQNPLQPEISVTPVSALASDLRRTAGYIVADRNGRLVGKVECPMYGTAPDVPDALAVKSGLFSRRRRLVPADTIEQIDGASGVIGLRVDLEAIRSFL